MAGFDSSLSPDFCALACVYCIRQTQLVDSSEYPFMPAGRTDCSAYQAVGEAGKPIEESNFKTLGGI